MARSAWAVETLRTAPIRAQFVGKGAVKLFGARVFAPPCPEYLAFDAQAYLVELPVLQTGG